MENILTDLGSFASIISLLFGVLLGFGISKIIVNGNNNTVNGDVDTGGGSYTGRDNK